MAKENHICVSFISKESCTITNYSNIPTNFTLDKIFHFDTPQDKIFKEVALSTVEDVLKGYNGTIFTYGQSGSGKTYTMYGLDFYDDEFKGIIPRAIDSIFEFIEDEKNSEIKFELKFSMLEIYKENLYDLLNPDTKHSDLKIKEHPKKGIYVTNLTEEYIYSQEEMLLLLENAEEYRVVSETGLNKSSSRSHLLFQLTVTQKFIDDTEKIGILNMVDLAGSEKVSIH
jgi:kinesin family protein 5